MDETTFLQELIKVDTSNPPGNEHDLALIIANRARQNGLEVNIFPLQENRSNLQIKLRGNGNKGLLFCGHMDTVKPGTHGWKHPPYQAEIEGNLLFGRGSSDMKSGLAAMYLAVESIQKEGKEIVGNIEFLATAGEEVDCCGAKHYIQNHSLQNIDAIVIGEPTNEQVVAGHKGALWLEIITHGKTAHSSMPDKGSNAVEHMFSVMEMIQRFRKYFSVDHGKLGSSSIEVTKIEGGIQKNMVPDKCVINLDIRTVPPQEHHDILSELNFFINENQKTIKFDYEINAVLDRPAILTPTSAPIIQSALELKNQDESYVRSVPYYTDASVLNPESKVDTLFYGPGDPNLAHQPNEYVDIQAFLRSIDFYKKLALNYFK